MTLASLLLLAVIDSINPSAIVVTLYLLSRSEASVQVAVYIAMIFLTYFSIGLMVILGIGAFLPPMDTLLRSPGGLVVQLLVGLALLIYGMAGSTEGKSTQPLAPPSARTYAALALLGLTVTMMEFPTSLPYFAAIAVITSADLPLEKWLPLLGLYNLIFVLPPALLLAGHMIFGQQLRERYASLTQRLQQGAHTTALWIAGLVGSALTLTSAIELVARLR